MTSVGALRQRRPAEAAAKKPATDPPSTDADQAPGAPGEDSATAAASRTPSSRATSGATPAAAPASIRLSSASRNLAVTVRSAVW